MSELSYWRKRIFLTAWLTYASFYLCRANMSIAIPGIMSEFGISKTAIGAVLTSLFTVYAIGQFVNGQLGDKFGARNLVFVGIIVSAILNIIFGFTNGFLLGMMILWGINGFFQSMGWAPTVKTVANWFPSTKRGRVGGLFGSSYQIGNAASWALAGFVTGLLGWRWAFWIPAGIFLISGLHWFLRIRNAPEEIGLGTVEEHENGIKNKRIRKDHHLGFMFTIKTVLKSPWIWAAALALFGLNIVRYGFLDWAPTYLFEVQGATISKAAYKAIAIPLAGSLGAVFAGFLSDKKFKGRRAPIAALMLFVLTALCFIYPRIPHGAWFWDFLILLGIGFTTYGPHVLIVTIMPMEFGTRKAAASTAGFIDGFGYIGAALTGIGTGWLVDSYGWSAAFNFWLIGALIAGILMLLIWNYKPEKGKYR